MNKSWKYGRAINQAGMAYAPTNEQGVVFLFGMLAKKLGFTIEGVRTGFPDCIAKKNGKSVQIEFEYHASGYKCHPADGADFIVCWDNDWKDCPEEFKHIKIIDLKSKVGASAQVFAVGCDERRRGKDLSSLKETDWSVPKRATVGDLIVMYRNWPASEIRDLWEILGRPFYQDKQWGRQAYMKKLVTLKTSLKLSELKKDINTRNMKVVRKNFQGKTDITEDWPFIYDKIVRNNPSAKKKLGKFIHD